MKSRRRPVSCEVTGMCIKGKQRVNYFALAVAIMILMHLTDWLLSSALAQTVPRQAAGIGGVELGENLGGVTDRIYIAAPPNWEFTVSLERGNFLDCGAGMAVSQTDADGRDVFPLSCGVTLTETLVIPSASRPAKLIIHY